MIPAFIPDEDCVEQGDSLASDAGDAECGEFQLREDAGDDRDRAG